MIGKNGFANDTGLQAHPYTGLSTKLSTNHVNIVYGVGARLYRAALPTNDSKLAH